MSMSTGTLTDGLDREYIGKEKFSQCSSTPKSMWVVLTNVNKPNLT